MNESSANFTPPPENSIRAAMHDINGQLFIIRGMTELLSADLPPGGTGAKRVEKILGACEKIAKISGEVATRARMENL